MSLPSYIATVSKPDAAYRLFSLGNYRYQIVCFSGCDVDVIKDWETEFEHALEALRQYGAITSHRYQ